MAKISHHWLWRFTLTVMVLAVLALASLVLGLRYWVLPNISAYQDLIVERISHEIGQPVAAQSIEAGWDGLRPHFILENVLVRDRDGQPALSFEHLEGTLAWANLALGEIRLHSLKIEQPNLKIRRLSSGEVFIGGILVNGKNDQPGFADWLVRQRRIEVRNATVSWQDEMRGSPVLELKNAGLLMRNRGSRHQLGIRAELLQVSSNPIDFRVDFKSDSLSDFSRWSGRFYARTDHGDLTRWKTWVDLPAPVETGKGGIRVWGDFSKGSLNGLIADVNLSELSGKLAPDLPLLRLDHLSGRLAWSSLDRQQLVEVARLGATLHGRPAIAPMTASLKLGSSSNAGYGTGDLKLDAVSLSSLREVTEFTPLDRVWVDKLERISPRGSLSKLRMSWKGNWPNPAVFEFKSDFKGLGIRPMALDGGKSSPGFSNFNGHVGLDQSGGAIVLNSHLVSLDFPGIFEQPIALESLNTQLEWRIKDNQPRFKLTRAEFSNKHLAGSASGTYQASAQGPGQIDLTGKLTRADARFIRDYLPLVIGSDTRDWVGESITAGSSRDVRLRLKGDLAQFPFDDGKSGIFEVLVKGSGADLKYAPDWPAINDIGVELLFRGKGLDIWANSGRTFDMKIRKVHARIPDMDRTDVVLELEGDASGPADSMLRFIDQSPVSEIIAGFSKGIQGTGEGKLNLNLTLPLGRMDLSKVAGDYQFQNVTLNRDAIPPLERLNGKLHFTDRSVSSPGIRGQFLGGQMVIGAKTEKSQVAINLAGKINAAGVRKIMPNTPALSRLSGEANWNGKVAVTREAIDAQFNTNLQGIRSDFPQPFHKRAVDSIPLQFERKANGGGSERLTVSYGKVAKLQLERRTTGNSMTLDRGVLHFGANALKLPPSGFWVTGSLPYLDIDHWRSLSSEAGNSDESLGADGVDMVCTTMDVFGKRLNNLRVNGSQRDGIWQGAVESKEMSGKVSWDPHGAGRLTGRFASLGIPDSAPPKLTVSEFQPVASRWPALDITAEAFSMKAVNLGKLELQAQPIGQDWRIESLKLNTEESSLALVGMWQDWLINPRSQVNMEFETRDIGKFLARIGYPESVSGGQAKMKGQLTWAGSPAEIDYPSLSGALNLDARKGQFLKVEPGIGKLLGVLNLQSLPRRISLDFKDVFSEGFAFDDISGTVKIAQGTARSSDFRMEGPAAKVSMKGETDLVHETQNLNVRVVPVFGDTVSGAATLLGGPVVGLTAYLVQKALKDPIGQMASYEYGVTGSWDNPVVEKLKKQSADNQTWGAH
ncbi:MAG: YhdP family protein [Sulfuricellaceae bacterium]|nr:YhdP family protein [Sulfuricellaceae bacterium]